MAEMAIRVNILTGCTAGGKSAVGLVLARRLGGEILSIDSMKVYRRMDIGTAKPSAGARREVPHHLIDEVEPSESYSLARYLEAADAAIRAIAARGRPIIAVGGTMLYLRGLLSGVFEGPPADPEFRTRFRERARLEGPGVLHAELARVDPEAASRIHVNDLRRIERAMEVYHACGEPISRLQTQWNATRPGYDCRLAALCRPVEETNRRINARVRRMMEEGLLDEVRALLSAPGGIGPQAAAAVGYAELIAHLKGVWTLEEAVERIKINSRRLGKHQRTWMRRMPGLRRVEVGHDESVERIAERVLEAWDSPPSQA